MNEAVEVTLIGPSLVYSTPDVFIAASVLLSENPYQGLRSKNPAQYPGISEANSTASIGLRAGQSFNRVWSRYTGKERDAESGLDYFGARFYASSLGRWLSPDWDSSPVAIPYADRTNPQSFNLYSYTGNNPLNRTDFDGHCTNGGRKQGFWWCLFSDSDQDADYARQNLAQYRNISINGKTPADAAKGLSNTQTVNLNREVTNFLLDNMLSNPKTQVALILVTAGAEGIEASLSSTAARGIETANGLKIVGYTEHGLERAIGEGPAGTPGVRAGTSPGAILDALKNPVKPIETGIDSKGRPFQTYTGQNAKVVVNPMTGRIVSTMPLSGAGALIMPFKSEYILSDPELAYIRHLASDEPEFGQMLNDIEGIELTSTKFMLLPDEAKKLREYFFDRLSRVGFDEVYLPNTEGRILELLVDKLFVR